MKPTPRQATIYDIAKLAGVSHTTVSSAMRDSGRISPERASQIRKIARDLNYQPKAAAQMLRARQTGSVGLVVPMGAADAAEHGAMGPIMTGFVKVCETEGRPYHIEFVNVDEDAQDPEDSGFEPPRMLSGQLVDAVIVAGYLDPPFERWLHEQDRYPWVRLEEDDRHCVRGAADAGVTQATQHLAALGHRRIAYALGPSRYDTMQLGREAFLAAADDYALIVDRERWMPSFELTPYAQRMEEYAAWARRVLGGPDRPTAIICHMMTIARAAIHVATRMGIDVPDELSIVAVGSPGDALKGYPCLTAIEPDFEASLEQAMSMLSQLLRGRRPSPKTRWIAPRLVERGTTAAAPSPTPAAAEDPR